ncbi:S-adenosyl-L-methionine-dependent methyltransferase [Exophiala viscosa]|uniref:S-adenosyl-L-methionine-dependent methyltransferase n=1 Tax=Exophiala viscosa TaxID=2486360 RepID=UPI0021952956|nr:S-adenosyl-L-methionine-dependent methyltransferase [Exophiala viscosa]
MNVMEPDDNFTDEGFDIGSSTASYVTSIATEIREGIEEYGRRYAAYGKHFYGLPIDQEEQERNDLQHSKFLFLYEGRLHLAPVVEDPHHILDLGTGNGTWAIQMADAFPSASVTGVDIAAVQPTWVPPNCQFEIMDVESDWEFPKGVYDLIHARELIFAIRDWPALISQAREHLRPGGYLELSVTVPEIGCDDGTCPPDSCYREMSAVHFQIADAMGVDGRAAKKWKAQLESQGFEDVHERIYKIPTNRWPKDKRLKTIGALEVANFLQYSSAGFERGSVALLGKDPAELQVVLAHARKEVLDRNIHSYVYFYNVYGWRPPSSIGD